MGRTICGTFLLAFGLLAFSPAHAQLDNPNSFSFDGLLLDDSTGNPMTGPVALKIQIYNPAANCLLYEEDHAAVALDGAGGFSVRVGTGTRNAGADGGLAWKSIFSNKGALIRAANGGTCGASYTPAAGDSRKIRVTVNSVNVLTPDFTMSTVPFATTADTLQGLAPSDLVLAGGGSAVNGFIKMNSTAAVRFADSGGTNYVSVRAPASLSGILNFVFPATAGSAGNILATDGAGNLTWTNTVANATYASNAGQIQGFNISSTPPSANQVLTWNGSTWMPMTVAGTGGGAGTVTAIAAGPGLIGGVITSVGTIQVDVGTSPNKIVQLNGSAQLPAVDGSLLTNLNAMRLQARDVSPVAPTANQVLGWNGSIWIPMTIAGTGGGSGNFMADGTVAMTGNFRLASNWLSGDGGNEGLVVDAAGRVGVGTNIPAPGAALDIFGAGTGNSAFLVPRDTAANRPAGISGMMRYNTTLAKFEVFENGAWLNLVGSGGGTNATTLQSYPVSAGAPSPGYVLTWNGSQWMPLSPGAGNPWTVAGSDVYYNVGAVGIGTTVPLPGAALDVNGSGSLSSMIVPRGTTAQRPAGVNGMIRYNVNTSKFETYEGGNWVGMGAGFPMRAPTGNATAPDYSFGHTNNTGMFSTGVGNLSFATAGTERVRISNAGNVGIGTLAPAFPLQVHANTGSTLLSLSNNTGPSLGMAFSQAGTDLAYLTVKTPAGEVAIDAGADAFPEIFVSDMGQTGFGTTTPLNGAIADFNGVGASLSSIIVPRDSAANRPAGVNGMIRFNTTVSKFEVYETGWKELLPPPIDHGILVYNTTSSFTVPNGVNHVKVTVIGGGGGGCTASGGGGMGAVAVAYVNSLVPGANISVTVGAGGPTGANGTAGGMSQFGSHVTANAGAGCSGGISGSDGTPSFGAGPQVSGASMPFMRSAYNAGMGGAMGSAGQPGVVVIEW